jgi:hypothetical protein
MRRRLHRMCQTLDWGICNSQLAWCWLLRAPDKVSRTCSTVSAYGSGRHVRFAMYRQPLCWNFLYHSWLVLSIGDSVWYLVRNLHCTVTIDSVLANSKTECFLIPCPHHVLSWLPPSSETCKYAMAPITQTNLERFSAYWYASFCHVCLGCCAAKFGSSEGTYELPCIFNIHLMFTYWLENETGPLFRRVSYTWSDIPWFVEQTDFTYLMLHDNH